MNGVDPNEAAAGRPGAASPQATPQFNASAKVAVPSVKPMIAIVGAGLGAVVALGVLTSLGVIAGRPSSTAQPSAAAAASSPSPVASSRTMPPTWPWKEVPPGTYSIDWWSETSAQPPVARVDLQVPAGWWTSIAAGIRAGASIVKYPGPGPRNSPTLTVHREAVTQVKSDVCDPDGPFLPVGPTALDLVTALHRTEGLQTVGSARVEFGPYPAWRLGLRLADSCRGPEGRLIWEDAGRPGFAILKDGYAEVYVVDVDGARLVITTHYRGSSAADVAELYGIVASIDLRARRPAAGQLAVNVPFEWDLPPSWEGPKDGLYVAVNTIPGNGQGAEAMIMLTTFPHSGGDAEPCARLLSPGMASAIGPTAADLAAAVATAPGTQLVAGPSDVTVGGRAAKLVELRVRRDIGCDPGFFYAWEAFDGGAMWSPARPGDTLRVWVVEMTGTRLFIEAETTARADPKLAAEVQRIVDSIEFQ